MRRAALVALALVAFPARGQQLYGPDSPTPIQRPYPSPQVWAPFNVAQCLPTGGIGDVTQGATITTTRASTQTVVVPNTNQTTPGLIPEDAGTVSHVVWNGSALVDTKGNAWTQNGTVPQVPASWYAPPSAGVFSDTTYYSLGTGADPFDASTLTFCAVFTTATAANQIILSDRTVGAGWFVQIISTGTTAAVCNHAGNCAITAAGLYADGRPNIVCGGWAQGTIYSKVNSGATAAAAFPVTPDPTGKMMVGRYYGGGFPLPGTVTEVYATTTPWNEASVAALQSSVLAKIGKGTLSTCPAASLAVGVQGAEVYAAGTNLLAAGTMSDQANAAWVKSNVTVAADAGLAPDGTPTADRLTVTAGGSPATSIQTVTGAGANTRTPSIWIQAGTRGTTASIALLTDGAAPTCLNVTPTSTPTRYSVTGTSTPVTNTALAIYLTANCTGNATAGDNILVSMAQHEVGAYPTPFTTGSRAATASTVPLPALHTTNKWCIGVTATPAPGKLWVTGLTTQGPLWSAGTSGTINSAYLQNFMGGTYLYFGIYNASVTQKYVACSIVGWTTGSTHRVVACNQAGTMSIYDNGSKCSGAATGSDGIMSATPVLNLGSPSTAASFFDGALRDLRIYPGATYRAGM